MISQSVAKEFGENGKQVIPVFRKVPEGYVTIEADESTGTKVIAPKAKVK
jgi:hypothetical protein